MRITHGHTKNGKLTPEYKTWRHIKGRCLDKNNNRFKDYGGRGITVCDRWLRSFENFFNDVGEKPTNKHSLGRIDNNGNYEPGNVKWETAKEQANNTRRNNILEFRGEKATQAQWAEIIGITSALIRIRLKRGWSIERTLTTPARKFSYKI